MQVTNWSNFKQVQKLKCLESVLIDEEMQPKIQTGIALVKKTFRKLRKVIKKIT